MTWATAHLARSNHTNLLVIVATYSGLAVDSPAAGLADCCRHRSALEDLRDLSPTSANKERKSLPHRSCRRHIFHQFTLSSTLPLSTIFPPFPHLSHLAVPPNPHANPRASHGEVMRWDAADAEAVLERIWDFHDRLSDAILAVSSTHFLTAPPQRPSACARRNGYVFFKGRPEGGGAEDGGGGGSALAAAAEAMAEARSLHAIRSALEDLEDHLEFVHTVQAQQQAERDAAIARLEQSRVVLATRLAEHQGKKYRVIDETLAFVGQVSDKSRFISPEDLCATGQSGEEAVENGVNGSSIMANLLSGSLSLAKNSFRVDKIGGALGNAALFAVSMLAFLQLHQVTFRSRTQPMEYRKRIDYSYQSGSSQQGCKGKHLEVYLARG
ncbi:hypothetical protein ACQ4PT_064535 [Festuca glaucescens]